LSRRRRHLTQKLGRSPTIVELAPPSHHDVSTPITQAPVGGGASSDADAALEREPAGHVEGGGQLDDRR